MRTPQQRAAHYAARMQSTLIDPVLSAMQAQQQANFAAYAVEFYPFQEELRNFINLKGFDPSVVFQYEAMNGECYHAWKAFSGDARTLAFVNIQLKYVGWGLVQADTKAMFLAVWSVTVP